MATIKTTAKRNPITGDPVPVPAYARGRQTNFAGTDRKREPLTSGPGSGPAPAPVSKREARKSARALNKTLNEGIKKEGRVKQYYTGVPVQGKTRLERQMEKYGVEPVTNSKYSPREQRERNRTRLKLAKDKERAAKPTPVRDKIGDKLDKVLGRGKYDRGSMRKKIIGGGTRKFKTDDSCKGPKSWMD